MKILSSPGTQPIKRCHKVFLYCLLALFIGFGFVVELRGALQKHRKTDAGVYFRAAWAVRTGNDLYKITDDRGWHYLYPPFFAIFLSPLADPPTGEDRTGYLPYAVSVALWYVITLLLGFWGVHILANAVENTSRGIDTFRQPVFSERWWALRILPILIMLIPIGRSQVRGQVGLVISFLLCGAAACILYGKNFKAGLWLSAAICIKIIPAFLLIVPVIRRDWKMLSGTATGLLIGLIVIPAVVMGPQRKMESYISVYEEVLSAAAKGDTEGSRGSELTGITSTDSNSPMVVMHNIMYPSKLNRPNAAAGWVRLTHWLFALLITLVTLWAGGIGKIKRWYCGSVKPDLRELLFIFVLLPVMFIASPVFHPHYVSMVIPLILIVIAMLWNINGYPKVSPFWKSVFWMLFLGHLITSIDEGFFLYFRDFGVVLVTTLFLWIGGVILLHKTKAA